MQLDATMDGDLAGAIRALAASIPRALDNDLWDADDLAQYMRLSKKTVQTHIISVQGFPNPVILATGGKRWLAAEVKQWVLRRGRV